VSRPRIKQVRRFVYTYRFVDESDADQILTVDELRALRDRVSAEAAAARQARSAAQLKVPAPPAATPHEARVETCEAPQHLQHWARHPQSWPRRLAAVGCLALAGGTVTMLVITAHFRAGPSSAGEVPVPVLPTPVVSLPVVSVPPVTTSSVPEPLSPAPQTAVAPKAPIAPASDGSAEYTTKQPAATGHAPRSPYRPVPSRTSAPPTDGRPPPTVVNLDAPPSDAAANRTDATSAAPPTSCATGCTQGTVTKTPTSWSPAAPQ
jgi:hypothetical protein